MKPLGELLKNVHIAAPERGNGYTAPPTPAVKCPICQDAGWLRRDVPPGHPSFGRLYPCECKVREKNERLAEQLRQLSNLDAFLDHTFDEFDPSVEGVQEAYEAARAYARNPEGWLFFHGPVGTGKTHLAVAIALEVMQRRSNQRVLFAVVPDLLDHLRATFDPGSGVAYDERFDAIRNAQLLILDDLGTENTTPWAREKLYQIFNHRYNERSATVITSNQSLDKIEDRVRSRLLDRRLTKVISIDADDYRRPAYLPTPRFRR